MHPRHLDSEPQKRHTRCPTRTTRAMSPGVPLFVLFGRSGRRSAADDGGRLVGSEPTGAPGFDRHLEVIQIEAEGRLVETVKPSKVRGWIHLGDPVHQLLLAQHVGPLRWNGVDGFDVDMRLGVRPTDNWPDALGIRPETAWPTMGRGPWGRTHRMLGRQKKTIGPGGTRAGLSDPAFQCPEPR